MDVPAFLAQLKAGRHYREQIAAVRVLPARAAEFRTPARPLPERANAWLNAAGISQLYAHQAEAYDAVRHTEGAEAGEGAGAPGDASEREGAAPRDIVIATGTASGKTLCYQLPIVASLLEDPEARALYLAPAKALAYDQLGTLERLSEAAGLVGTVRPACYDGDTPTHKRQAIRRTANILLSNPDMLHVGILPYHAKWAGFLARLKYVVVDEVHTYRGIFGSHVAGVLWRLVRLCRHYGGDPTFICCSATLGNPRELCEHLLGRPVTLIDRDASPRGAKHVVLWNPPWLEGAKIGRRSGNVEAAELMQKLLEAGAGTIAFAKARVVTELLYKYLHDALKRRRPELAERLRPYRGGYLPHERREIEEGLFSGRLLGVCATNALELGIDVGSLDAAIVIGFPRTFCSLWQQVGRAGRRQDESLAIFVAYDDPIDQYLMRHAEFVFEQPLEHALVDPTNPHILAGQLRCAAFELPLAPEELTSGASVVSGGAAGDAPSDSSDDVAAGVANALAEAGEFKLTGDRYHLSSSEFPAAHVNLRTISDATYAIIDTTAERNEVIGQVDAISAPELVYPEAIYLHQGESFIVRSLDQQLHTARVEECNADYYTQPVLADDCRILAERHSDVAAGGRRFFGDVRVQWQTIAFRKFKFYSQELIGQTSLHLDPQRIDTAGCWLQPPVAALDAVKDAGHKAYEALSGVRNLLMVALPPLAMCDRYDIGGIVDSAQLGVATIFIYDRYAGGLGYARHAYDHVGELLGLAYELVSGCPCEDGCPGCVAPPNLRVAIHHDPDLARGYEIPDKRATLTLLSEWRRTATAGHEGT